MAYEAKVKGGAGEADQRHAIGQADAQQANRVEHMRQVFPRFELAQPVDALD